MLLNFSTDLTNRLLPFSERFKSSRVYLFVCLLSKPRGYLLHLLICLVSLQIPMKIVHRKPPAYVHNQRLLHMYHRGDIAKMEVLIEYGGIYLDYDVIVVNSMDPLRRYDATLGILKSLLYSLQHIGYDSSPAKNECASTLVTRNRSSVGNI